MINNMINATYFEKFFKDLIVEGEEELNENDLIKITLTSIYNSNNFSS